MSLSQLGQFHENPAVISWWHARAGRVLEWLTPTRRRTILALFAIWIGIKKPWRKVMHSVEQLQLPEDMGGLFLVIAALFLLLWLCYRAACNYAALPTAVRRHPLISLHLCYWGVVVLLLNTTPAQGEWRAIVVGVALVFPFLIWRLSYLLQSGQYGRVAGTRFRDHLFYLYPAFGGTNTPYGKGLDYLSRNEARTSEELAVSQLAGVKLLLLAWMLSILKYIFEGVIYGPGNDLTTAMGGYTLAIPRTDSLISGHSTATVWASWVSIYCELIRDVLKLAIKGHEIIAILRLFGFNVFRNTYKPLLAESVVEFWGRYYYYFKELLVNFFFMPTFAQLGTRLREWPNLRLFIAVFMAACIGNTYYHLLDIRDLLGDFHMPWSRMFYCLLLAVGIFISMWRQKRGAGQAPGLARRLLRISGVWTFFAFIDIWNHAGNDVFYPRSMFFLSLFGLV